MTDQQAHQDDEQQGGRVFFSNTGRSMEVEDEIELTSVGIDIGSSTSHLAFSRIVLERLDTRYIVVERTLLHQSEVLLTPYSGDNTIDAVALGRFIEDQYAAVGLKPDEIDTGALILTGVAVRRANARAIGELFSAQAGKFVVVSAGDGLETTLAAFGSGAVARSGREKARVLNVDIGGGTSKLALCENGALKHLTAVDIGARLIALDPERRVERVEPAGRHFASLAGVSAEPGTVLSVGDARKIAELMVDHLLAALKGGEMDQVTLDLHRLDPLPAGQAPDAITVSGGVSEFFYGQSDADFSDLGPLLAETLRKRLESWSPRIEEPEQRIRATVVGASQYTVQVSGSTIYVEPLETLPVRNVPVVKPDFDFPDAIDPEEVARKIAAALLRFDLDPGETPIALCYRWRGSASYGRLDGFCAGVKKAFAAASAAGHPVILVGQGDIGGLVGMHCRHELGVKPVVSIDGIALDEFDFIDIGQMLKTSGAVPVVIKSLVFPSNKIGKVED